jgi:predicted dehydrogenase
MKVKIFGAGSIGNHLANASRVLGWSVDVVDVDPAALGRMKDQIYPGRYKSWDSAIRLFEPAQAPRGGYDLICIGTPPDSHIGLARAAVAEGPKAILIEKPLCGPDLAGLDDLVAEASAAKVASFVGYDHVVGRAARHAAGLLRDRIAGQLQTLDVEFREEWGGIFAAHPWLAGPADSYLGFSRRGGGAAGEHSHALNLWQHFAHEAGAGRVVEVQATLDIVRNGSVDYDRLALMTLKTEAGLIGRCVQDVVTKPPRKWARIQGEGGYIEWWAGREPGQDMMVATADGGKPLEHKVTKTRPQDFIEELEHIAQALADGPSKSPISLVRGLETMMVIAAAHMSHATGRRVAIDYSKGWNPGALKAC